MDGGPHQMIATGETWEPAWMIDQPASTLWYHPHPHGETARHVYQGVAGLWLIEDDASAALELPRAYGVDDIPLIIQDKRFTDGGELTMGTGSFFQELGGSASFGVLGDTILVNGTYNPHLEMTRERLRFRILNGANARFSTLGFADDRTFRLVATENGLVPGAPIDMTRLQLGPGERAEIVVAFAPGESVVLRSLAQDLGGSGRQVGSNDTFDLLELRAGERLEPSRDLPATLAEPSEPAFPENATVRTFRLEGHGKINGEQMDMGHIDEVVPAGALEIWEVESNGLPHTFHIHGATFSVIAVEGRAPEAALRGSKDTVFVGPNHAVTLAVQFGERTDPQTPYMYHCHILRHEDNGMMGQFVVVEPGTEDSVPRTIAGHGAH
jgi:FtsP/CotA-like multicopper oxidase with cupredoxin domain